MDPQLISLIIKIVVAIAIVGVVSYGVYSIKKSIQRKLSKVSRLIDTIKAADDEQMYTPKTLSGTESIHLSQLRKDFPDFNPTLAKTYVRSFVTEYFTAMREKRTDLTCFEDTCSRQFIEMMMAEFAAPAYTYSQVKIHKIVISDYRKNVDEANVSFQLALQYVSSKNNRLSQEKYTVTYSYFLETGAQGEMASVICQHCGAPVNSLGTKICPYCDAAITAVAMDRTWKITDIKKTTY